MLGAKLVGSVAPENGGSPPKEDELMSAHLGEGTPVVVVVAAFVAIDVVVTDPPPKLRSGSAPLRQKVTVPVSKSIVRNFRPSLLPYTEI